MKHFMALLILLGSVKFSFAQFIDVKTEKEAEEKFIELNRIFKRNKDKKIYFNGIYLIVTRELQEERLKRVYKHPECLEGMIIKFANMYLGALKKNEGHQAPLPWKELFEFKGRPATHLLLGMNAHIRYDLPLSLYYIQGRYPSCTPENIKDDYFKLNDFFIRITPLLDQELKRLSGSMESHIGWIEGLERALMIKFIKSMRREAWTSFEDLLKAKNTLELQQMIKRIERYAHEKAVLYKNMNPLIPSDGL